MSKVDNRLIAVCSRGKAKLAAVCNFLAEYTMDYISGQKYKHLSRMKHVKQK